VLQSTGIDPYLTVRETIELYGGYYPRPRPVEEIIEVVGLVDKRETRVAKLSGGQQRRLDMAIGLAGDPDLLFLDEPTTGFDPSARRNAWEVVKNLADLGKTIFLTTHYMDEAQYLANEVAVISKGKIVARGAPGTLSGRDTAATRISFVLPANAPQLPEHLRPTGPSNDGTVHLTSDDPTRTLYRLTGWAVEHDLSLDGLTVSRPSLEDVYLEITDGETGAEVR